MQRETSNDSFLEYGQTYREPIRLTQPDLIHQHQIFRDDQPEYMTILVAQSEHRAELGQAFERSHVDAVCDRQQHHQ